MKKTISALLLAALMLLTLVPTVAFAATWYDVYVDGIAVTSDNKTDVLGEKDGDSETVTYNPAGASTNAKLTLNGASLTTINYVGNGTLDIEVIGENTVTPTASQFGIITWRDENKDGYAENTNASLKICGNGTLTVDLTGSTASEQHNGILANEDLTITGINLTIRTGSTTSYNRGLHAKNITIDGATVNATVGASTGKSPNAISAAYDVIIKNSANVTAVAGNSTEADSVAIFAVNNVKIIDKETKVSATAGQGLNSCGISAKNAVEISGGAVTATARTATAASVGILASNTVLISGGKITAQAGSGYVKAAIAATADGENFGELTVGAADNVAKISGAKGITRGDGKIANGYIEQSAAAPVVIDFAARNSSIATLLAVAVSTVVTVRSITNAAKLVVGVPMALAIAPQVLRTLGRLVFFPKFF